MIRGFDLDDFIARRVTGRARSLFADDLEAHEGALRAALEGRSLLVVGGAGTIGGAFVREALRYRPARLVVVDTSENGLTELTRDLRSTAGQYVPEATTTYPIDFGSPTFARLFAAEGPFDLVARSGAERFFCVPTDKAANPANVMGASQKLMEDAVLAYAAEGLVPATTARFANVAFSAGSLPAGFLERIARHQPLSAPSDVRRYFVSPAESGQLCLAACALGEPGDIAFPRLGVSELLAFDAIADALLEELGYVPERFPSEEEARRAATAEPASRADRTWPVHYFATDTSAEKAAEVRAMAAELGELFERPELGKAEIVETLGRLVPTLRHVETGRGLDQRM